MAKNENYKRLIHTSRWVRLRRIVLTEHPLCERCMSEGRITAASEVHHRRPVEEAFSLREMTRLMFDKNNLMALCHNCHVKTHTEMGRCGKVANIERNKKQANEIFKKLFGNKKTD